MLKRGSTGISVVQLQNMLNAKTILPTGTAPLVADGQYGPATESMVKLYQAQNGLPIDGVAGAMTLAKLGIAPSSVNVGPAGTVINSNSGTTIPVAPSSSNKMTYVYAVVGMLAIAGALYYFDTQSKGKAA